MTALTSAELVDLVRSVFPRLEGDRGLALLVDVPRDPAHDNAAWAERRRMAFDWFVAMRDGAASLSLERVWFYAYPDVGSNNADLPPAAVLLEAPPPETADRLAGMGRAVAFDEIFREHQILIAPTEFSTTAPLKVAAPRAGFRAATMPGFAVSMVPALRVDYGEVARRVDLMKERLDRADRAEIRFAADDGRTFTLVLDLAHRAAHASSGRFPARGTAGNLPSGEAYIVPYEGERGVPSRSEGELPVQLGEEIVVFTIRRNRAVDVTGSGEGARAEIDHLRREPAYGNMAELGFGVLGDFGLEPVGEILLDEKLGLHVAFGRSDHFGGSVGPGDFSSPAAVIHLDRIYIPSTQPRIQVPSVTFTYPDGTSERIMENGRTLVF